MINIPKINRVPVSFELPSWIVEQLTTLTEPAKGRDLELVLSEILAFSLNYQKDHPVTRDQWLDYLQREILVVISRAARWGVHQETIHSGKIFRCDERLIGQAVDELLRWGKIELRNGKYHRTKATVFPSQRKRLVVAKRMKTRARQQRKAAGGESRPTQ